MVVADPKVMFCVLVDLPRVKPVSVVAKLRLIVEKELLNKLFRGLIVTNPVPLKAVFATVLRLRLSPFRVMALLETARGVIPCTVLAL